MKCERCDMDWESPYHNEYRCKQENPCGYIFDTEEE